LEAAIRVVNPPHMFLICSLKSLGLPKKFESTGIRLREFSPVDGAGILWITGKFAD